MKQEKPIPIRKVDRSRRFTDDIVWSIRRRIRAGAKMQHLANEFGVTRRCVADAAHGTGAYKDV